MRLRVWETWAVIKKDSVTVRAHFIARHWTQKGAMAFAVKLANDPTTLAAELRGLAITEGRPWLRTDYEIRRATND